MRRLSCRTETEDTYSYCGVRCTKVQYNHHNIFQQETLSKKRKDVTTTPLLIIPAPIDPCILSIPASYHINEAGG